jgi:polyphosphate kinase
MRRNLDRRIEVVAPVENLKLIELIESKILEPCLKDNVRSWELHADGHYHRVRKTGEAFDAQSWFLAHPLAKYQF